MLGPQVESTWLTKTLPEALKIGREHVYAVENLCSTPELSSKIIHWDKASPETIRLFIDEIERVYKLCRDKAEGKVAMEGPEPDRIFPTEILDNLQDLLSKKKWRFLAARKLRDENTNRVYSVSGWDGSTPVGPSRIASKLGMSPKGTDAWIFLADAFSHKTIEEFGSRQDVAMINMSNKAVSGGLASDDPLLGELRETIDSHERSPDRAARSSLKGTDPYVSFASRESARIFNEHFRLSDCGHLQTSFYGRGHLGFYAREPLSWRRPISVEEKLKRTYSPSSLPDDDPEKILSEMEH